MELHPKGIRKLGFGHDGLDPFERTLRSCGGLQDP